jgi:hexulose-6-phosphate isomerase
MSYTPYQIAILQGRLSPDLDNRYQFFPPTWKDEFPKAKELGFDAIEWLVDPKGWKDNPILTNEWSEALELSAQSQLPISGVCADWFMQVNPFEGDPEEHRASLRKLMMNAKDTTNRLMLMPLLETHPILEIGKQDAIVELLTPLIPELEAQALTLAFETELPKEDLAAFVDRFGTRHIGVYYDTGNCTSYGFDCPEDIRYLGARIKGVHIKDRKKGTTQSKPLGEGDADIVESLKALHEVGWAGTLIMQAWRGPDYVDDAKKQLAYLRAATLTAST